MIFKKRLQPKTVSNICPSSQLNYEPLLVLLLFPIYKENIKLNILFNFNASVFD